MDELLHDPFGQTFGSIDHDGMGGATVRDAFGHVTRRFVPDAGGGGTWFDPFNHVVDRVQELGGVTRHLTPTGALKYTEREFGGRTLFENPLGQMFASEDPMTGNVTNALGALMFRKASF